METQAWYHWLTPNDNGRCLQDDYKDKYLVISRDCGKTKEYSLFTDEEIFYKAYSSPLQHRCYYEVISGRQKPHFDIDIKDEHIENCKERERVGTLVKEKVIEQCHVLIPTLKEESILVFNSHGEHKRSYHIVLNHWYHEDCLEAKAFYGNIISNIPSEYSRYVDPKVYGQNQNFRILGSHKIGSVRPKVFEGDFEDDDAQLLYDSLVSNVKGCKPLYSVESLIPGLTIGTLAPAIKIKQDVIDTIVYTNDQLESVRVMLQDFAGGIFSIRKCTGYRIELKKNCKSYICPCCSGEHHTNNSFIYLHNGEVRLKCYGIPKEDPQYCLVGEIEPIDIPLPSPSRTYEEVKKNFELNRFKCLDSSLFYEINERGIITRSKEMIKTAYQHLNYQKIREDVVTNHNFMKDWFFDENMRIYNNVKLLPPPLECPEGTYNLWSGFRISKIEISGSCQSGLEDGVQFYLDHIRLIFGDECYDYTIKWIAMLFQLPGKKPDSCIIVKSLQGLGKELFFKVLECIIGKQYCLLTQSVARSIFGSFNGMCEGKLLFGFDEMNMSVSSKFAEEIKDFISNPHISINKKMVNEYETDNLNHTFVFSNKEFPWKMEESDRRSVAIDRIGVKVPDKAYIAKMLQIRYDSYVLNEIYQYFMNVDISGFIPGDKPETEFMRDLKDLNRSREWQFIDHYIGALVLPDAGLPFAIATQDLFTEFRSYLTIHYVGGDYKTSDAMFGKKLKNLGITGISFSKDKTRRSIIKIDVAVAQTYLNNIQ